MSRIGLEVTRDKADDLMETYMLETLKDERAHAWWSKTWSMKSGHGRWSICHGQYGGYTTNASTERGHREDKEPCSPKATMGEYLGVRFKTIKEMGKEHRNKLKEAGRPNRFISIPRGPTCCWRHVRRIGVR